MTCSSGVNMHTPVVITRLKHSLKKQSQKNNHSQYCRRKAEAKQRSRWRPCLIEQREGNIRVLGLLWVCLSFSWETVAVARKGGGGGNTSMWWCLGRWDLKVDIKLQGGEKWQKEVAGGLNSKHEVDREQRRRGTEGRWEPQEEKKGDNASVCLWASEHKKTPVSDSEPVGEAMIEALAAFLG